MTMFAWSFKWWIITATHSVTAWISKWLILAALMAGAHSATLAQPTPVPQPTPIVGEAWVAPPVVEQQAAEPTIAPAPAPELTPAPEQVAPCSFAQDITVADTALQDATTLGIARLTDALGCVPFTPGRGGIIVQFDPVWFSATSDPSGFDWTWVLAAAPFAGPTRVIINPQCWDRVNGDWSIVIAHELGHHLGWLDMDGNPYMACPLVEGEYYRSDLVVVCRP